MIDLQAASFALRSKVLHWGALTFVHSRGSLVAFCQAQKMLMILLPLLQLLQLMSSAMTKEQPALADPNGIAVVK